MVILAKTKLGFDDGSQRIRNSDICHTLRSQAPCQALSKAKALYQYLYQALFQAISTDLSQAIS